MEIQSCCNCNSSSHSSPTCRVDDDAVAIAFTWHVVVMSSVSLENDFFLDGNQHYCLI